MNEHPVLDQVCKQYQRQTLRDGAAYHLAECEARELRALASHLVGVFLVHAPVKLIGRPRIIADKYDCHDDKWECGVELADQPADTTANATKQNFPFHSRVFF